MKPSPIIFRLILFLCLAVSVTGCGKLRSQRLLLVKTPGPGNNIAGLQEPPSAPLNSTELPIALRICQSLLAKRQFLTTTISGQTSKRIAYDFSLERKDCNQKVIETKALSAEILSSNPDLYYNPTESPNYFKDVITDTTIALSEACPAVIADPTNAHIKNSLFPFNSDKIYFFKFGTDKGFDTVQINTKIANGKGGYDPQDTQLITIFTNASQVLNPRDVGAEKERSQYNGSSCSGGAYTTKKETFVRSVFL